MSQQSQQTQTTNKGGEQTFAHRSKPYDQEPRTSGCTWCFAGSCGQDREDRADEDEEERDSACKTDVPVRPTEGKLYNAVAGEDSVCVPLSVLNDLFCKINHLTSTVEKQAVLDIEKRLKEEMKLREKLLLEQISGHFSKQTSKILAKQARKKKENRKKGKRSESADTIEVLQTVQQTADTGRQHHDRLLPMGGP